ncbi:MAG: PepSY domain-containing protein [Planctomycetia bacterium]|nr:PepSY domain-containing protein [Planctomycetia bacterium]
MNIGRNHSFKIFPITFGICLFCLALCVFANSEADQNSSANSGKKSASKDPSEKPLFAPLAKKNPHANAKKINDSVHKMDLAKEGVRFTEEDAREFLKKRVPNGEIMELNQDFSQDRFIFRGRIFLEKAGKIVQNGVHYNIGRKYEFTIDAHTGKMIYWKGFDYPMPVPENGEKNRKMIDELKVKEIVGEKVPGSTILDIEWNMNEQNNFYMGTMYKDGIFYRFIVDAWTGKILDWKEKAQSDISASEMNAERRDRYIYMARERIIAFLHSKVPGAQITRLELNIEGNMPLFEGQMIHHRSVYYFKINALTGKLEDWKQKTSKTPYQYRRGSHTASMPVIPSMPIVPLPEIPVPPAPPRPPVPFR